MEKLNSKKIGQFLKDLNPLEIERIKISVEEKLNEKKKV